MTDGLNSLETELRDELSLLTYPPTPWVTSPLPGVLDVAIIGAGMAGLSAAFGLMRQGISNIQVFDENPPFREGPWATYARMRTLRSTKELTGPAFLPKLTFQAWYKAQYGVEGWDKLYKIPTLMWMDYLNWYRTVLAIPVKNNCRINSVGPSDKLICLAFDNQNPVYARKVVLATGRGGFGGIKMPQFAAHLPKDSYAHTCETIDFESLKNKDVCVVGCGASGFDAAAEALEKGAKTVTMLTRRPAIPFINKFSSAVYPGFTEGFYLLPDEAKVKFIGHSIETGSTPPFESLDRVKMFPNFKALTDTHIEGTSVDQNQISLKIRRNTIHCDFVIFATGFDIDGQKQPELKAIFNDIALWKDIHPNFTKFGKYPYLGRHYEFIEKTAGAASYLRNVYCFNFSAILSHGLTSGDVPSISAGACRLSQGIAADFFTQHWEDYYSRFEGFVKPEFVAANYPFIGKNK